MTIMMETDSEPNENINNQSQQSQQSEQRQYLDKCIEEATTLSTELTFSALRLSACCGTRTNSTDDELLNIENELHWLKQHPLYTQLLRSPSFSTIKQQRQQQVKSKHKSGSTSASQSVSLFDLFPASSFSSTNNNNNGCNSSQSLFLQQRQKITIRDLLSFNDEKETNNSHITDDDDSLLLLQTKCYESDIIDIILGFNTTQSEIQSLANLLLRHLIIESTTKGSISIRSTKKQKEKKSFLDIHSKWIKECMQYQNEEECHLFAFILLRNILLSLHEVTLLSIHPDDDDFIDNNNDTTKLMLIQMTDTIIELMILYSKQNNDTLGFQSTWLELVTLFMEICFASNIHCNNSQKDDDDDDDEGEQQQQQQQQRLYPNASTVIITYFAYYDMNGKLFSQWISYLSSPLVIQRHFIQMSLVPKLIDWISHLPILLTDEGDQNVIIRFLRQQEQQQQEHEGDYLDTSIIDDNDDINVDFIVMTYLLSVLKEIILNLSPIAFSFIMNRPTANGILSSSHPFILDNCGKINLEKLNIFVQVLLDPHHPDNNFQMHLTKNNLCSIGVEDSILYLLQPFYHLLDIGVTPDSCHLFTSNLGEICSEAIVYLILNGCAKDYILCEKIMSLLQMLLEKGAHSTQELETLTPAISALFQIHKRVLQNLPWNAFEGIDDWKEQHVLFWEKLFISTIQSLFDVLLSTQGFISLDASSWNNSLTVLLPIILIIKRWNRPSSFSRYEEMILSVICHYERKVSVSNRMFESLLLIHCILFSFKNQSLTDEYEHKVGYDLSMCCFRKHCLTESKPLVSTPKFENEDEILILSLLRKKYCLVDDIQLHSFTKGLQTMTQKNIEDLLFCKLILNQIHTMLISLEK